MLFFLQAYSKWILLLLPAFLRRGFDKHVFFYCSVIILLIVIRTFIYGFNDVFAIYRFFFGGFFLALFFRFFSKHANLTVIFIIMCLWTIAEGVLVNTILDASSLPNYPKITGGWNPHIAQDGLYQRPYSFGQNSSVTGFCIAVVYMVIRRKSALLLGLLIITEVIVASGTGILMLAIVLFQKFRLKNLGTVVLITFFGLWFFDLKEFYVSNKLSLDYLDYLIELKTYQLREYSYFSTVEKFIGVKDVRSTNLGFGGDFGMASFIYQFGYVGLIILAIPLFFTRNKLIYTSFLVMSFHYPVMFFVAGQIILTLIIVNEKRRNIQQV